MERPLRRLARSLALCALLHVAVLEHHAVLTLPDGTPFSLLVETYTGNVLAFPPPRNQAVPAAH